MNKRLSIFIIVAIISAGTYLYFLRFKPGSVPKPNVSLPSNPNIYEQIYPNTVLTDMWDSYKQQFIQEDGRTIDKGANLITTSEGQSYTLLRAVWVDDRQTFDKAWKWTNVNLKKRPNDKLFAWKWGQRSDGTWGILTEQDGMNTASDADQDIAMALILAYYRWNDQYYLDQARATLTDIWNTEVVTINGKPYLTAGNWADSTSTITVNPSYYSFAAYPLFEQVDPVHNWMGVKDTSYTVLFNFVNQLPPDWAQLNKTTLAVSPVSLNGKPVSFAQDASRIVWRVGLDWQENADPRALEYLKQLKIPETQWTQNNVLNDSYGLNGQPLSSYESLSMYSTLLPYFKYNDNNTAKKIIQEKIFADFNPDTGSLSKNIGYYDANWAWFGLAAYNNYLFFPGKGNAQ